MKIVGVVVLVLVVYFIWRFVVRDDALVLVTQDTGTGVSGMVKRAIPDKALVIEITNNGKERRITQISMPKSVASQAGFSEPAGFKIEALPLTEHEKKDKETVAFVERYNKENLRWVGDFKLPAESTTEFSIPAISVAEASGSIDFQYESKAGLGGSISFFRVNLSEQEKRSASDSSVQNTVQPSPQS